MSEMFSGMSVCLKSIWESGKKLHSYLTSPLDGGMLSGCPAYFNLQRKNAQESVWTVELVGTQREVSTHARNQTTIPRSPIQWSGHCTDSADLRLCSVIN